MLLARSKWHGSTKGYDNFLEKYEKPLKYFKGLKSSHEKSPTFLPRSLLYRKHQTQQSFKRKKKPFSKARENEQKVLVSKMPRRIYMHYTYKETIPCRHSELLVEKRCPFCAMHVGSGFGLVCHLICNHSLFTYNFVHEMANDEPELHITVLKMVKSDYSKVIRFEYFTGKSVTKELRALGHDLQLGKIVQNVKDGKPALGCTEQIWSGQLNNMSRDDVDLDWHAKRHGNFLAKMKNVSEPYRQFMNLWYRYIQHHPIYADHQVPARLVEFTKQYMTIFTTKKDMHQCLVDHMIELWAFGLLQEPCPVMN